MPKSRFSIVLVALAIGATFVSHAHACGAELIALVEAQDSKGVTTLLTQGCSDLEHRNRSGDTAVLIAARNGALDTLEALVGAGAKINVLDPKKRDVLNIAITTENPSLARKALALGADPTLVTSVYDGAAIIYGSAKGSVEIVKLLIDAGAPVNRVNNIGWTALLEVAVLGDGSKRYRQIARMLVAAGADRTIADTAGKTPYDHAQARGHGQLARILALP